LFNSRVRKQFPLTAVLSLIYVSVRLRSSGSARADIHVASRAESMNTQQPFRSQGMAYRLKCGKPILLSLSLPLGMMLTACSPHMAAHDMAAKQTEAQKKSSVDASAAIVLGVKKEAPPAPPAAAARPQFTTPPSYYEPVGPFFFYVETLTSTGPSNYGFTPTVPCTQTGVFKRGMRMVVRFEVLDTSTGKRVTDKDGATLKLVLPQGGEVPARWAIRGGAAAMPDSHWMWDTSWDIPPDYPLGSFDYSILVTAKDGRTARFTPPIQKAKTADSRVRIIE
jgi:hypothetical protein